MESHRGKAKGRSRAAALAATVATALVAGACSTNASPANTSVAPAPHRATASAPAAPAAPATSPRTIPQPMVEGLDVAPESARVDIALPTFSNPTTITNPLFPVSSQESVLMLGRVDGKPFRTEVTLLPETRVIEWRGLRVETVVSQYAAYLDGKIQEIAYDYYAQSDDGAVWYLGEDVFDFRGGAIVVTEGTWLAGRDGEAAMIMPGTPKVGDVYRPENAPGFVFEEVTVSTTDRVLDGPLGPIAGGLVATELHMTGDISNKVFAPGYGEFLSATGKDVEALALAVPTDAHSGPVPSELTTLAEGAMSIFDAAGSGSWNSASATVKDMASAWDGYRAGDVPRLIEPVMADALTRLTGAVDARDASRARNAAIEAARSAFDLQLRYRPAWEIDLARFDLWAAQLIVDAEAKDVGAVGADHFALDYARDRIRHAVIGADLTRLNEELGNIQVAVVDGDLKAAADAARMLRQIVAAVLGTS